jgi:nitrous oxidase accessory protein
MENIIHHNKYAIYITHSINNTIYGNQINNNTEFGCYLCCASNNNIIYRNTFNLNQVNAYDFYNNNWNNKGQGNYWDDYNGSDKNHDGIGDEPYLGIKPDARNKDYYPLGFFKDGSQENNETNGYTFLLLAIAVFLILILKIKYDKKY